MNKQRCLPFSQTSTELQNHLKRIQTDDSLKQDKISEHVMLASNKEEMCKCVRVSVHFLQ
jgi:hypothetical protein